MLARIIQFLTGAVLAGGGGYIAWSQRMVASNLFPPGPGSVPWFLIVAVLALAAGIVFLVSAVHPRPERRARLAAEAARRDAELSSADAYYAKRNGAADQDWRGGDIPAPVVPAPAEVRPVATSAPPAPSPFPSAATLGPIPVAVEPPPAAVAVPTPAAVAVAAPAPGPVAGPFAGIRKAIAEKRLDEADKLLTEARETAQGLELAELTALAGDHAAAAGRQSNAKWLWRLALKRFGELNAMDSAVARAVAENLRTAG
jgi:hypothetical protein